MPRPLAAALALAWGRCAAAAIICDPIPECADEATTIVRALIPKVGRAQSACAVGAQWGDECVTDCLSNLASVSYNGGAYSSATTAWMVGPNGTMVMSPDSGANWILKPSGTTSEINALVFPTAIERVAPSVTRVRRCVWIRCARNGLRRDVAEESRSCDSSGSAQVGVEAGRKKRKGREFSDPSRRQSEVAEQSGGGRPLFRRWRYPKVVVPVCGGVLV